MTQPKGKHDMKIYKIWLSGLVRRWHSNPDLAHTAQTNAQHQWGCAILAIYLFPDNHRLLIDAITHDVAEVGIGDVAGPAKRGDPALKAASEWAETKNFIHLELIEPAKSQEIKLIDRLEAYLWAERHAPNTIRGDGWPEALEDIKSLARHLRVYEKVCGCLKNF
jgi:5'-deoxynucleotidase YfbR-like HD superfamily hydrolase